ncbi:uncharacterized protein RCC_05011 [Ramularia collo-cygni]|uniref:F-box domain-containing protein n=1 Tax=Ramularia collo-cygni TaxID=112498 RepID=A0A2D3UXU4_9PEZI|nr:uncharacterized protein RCC_05011 [Ramularia collo-cygni]CZT19165.1 uncharacterized protein RCC_05011 [Ramularia collo-cygni]
MESAVDQLEAFSHPEDKAADMMIRFGELKMDDSLPRLFDFDAPTTCQKWPGLQFGSFCLHKQIPKLNTGRPKPKFSTKKRSRRESFKHGVYPGKASPNKSRKAKAQVLTPATYPPIPSRTPPAHLMWLPAEVRNQIWTLLSAREDPIAAQFRPIQPCRKGKITIRRFPQEPLLAAVSKQLRKEVLSLFYGLNKFVFETSTSKSLQNFDMTESANLQKWRPRADVAGFISQVEIRFVPQMVYQISRMADTLDIKAMCDPKKKPYPLPPAIMFAEKRIAQTVKDSCGGDEDLVKVAMVVIERRF